MSFTSTMRSRNVRDLPDGHVVKGSGLSRIADDAVVRVLKQGRGPDSFFFLVCFLSSLLISLLLCSKNPNPVRQKKKAKQYAPKKIRRRQIV